MYLVSSNIPLISVKVMVSKISNLETSAWQRRSVARSDWLLKTCHEYTLVMCHISPIFNPKQAGLFADWYGRGGGGADYGPPP